MMLIRGINFYLFVLISVIIVIINDLKVKRQNNDTVETENKE